MTRWQRNRDLTGGALVELGCAPGARAAAPGATRERNRQQAQLGHTIKMEGCGPPRDNERISHVVATYWQPTSAHVVIDAPPGRLLQTCPRRHICSSLPDSLVRSRPRTVWSHGTST